MKIGIRKSEKRKEKLRKAFHKQEELNSLLKKHGGDILGSDNFKRTSEYIQHGNMTVNNHCINVAKYSLSISRKLRIKCSQRELIRGALLHDYFLYDWHDKQRENRRSLHGFYHPGIALKNASREYKLTARERDIIQKHMWPLTVIPPQCREAWIVTTADKYCSLLETVHLHKGDMAKYTPERREKYGTNVKVQYQG
ncbi:MAG: HD domain-containing protein [Clostridiales bacterium]|mgnify:CR=1 FL=1|nr:HD domain-containing protein [Clostridiales bacterium]